MTTDVLWWIGALLRVYGFVLFARVVMSWILQLTEYRPSGVAAVFFEMVYTVTDPPLKLLRRWIPDLRIGNFALDVSFLVLILGVYIVSATLMAG